MVGFIYLLVILDGNANVLRVSPPQTLDTLKMYTGIHVKAELRNNCHTHNENDIVLNLLCEISEILYPNATWLYSAWFSPKLCGKKNTGTV